MRFYDLVILFIKLMQLIAVDRIFAGGYGQFFAFFMDKRSSLNWGAHVCSNGFLPLRSALARDGHSKWNV